jgi:hypothetical protein
MTVNEDLQFRLRKLSFTTRLLKVVQDRPEEIDLVQRLASELQDSPIRHAAEAMEATGILPALDDAPELVFGHFRRAAIPREDLEVLLTAGFTMAEIDVLFAIAVNTAAKVGSHVPSAIVNEAAAALEQTLPILTRPLLEPPPKKRKLLNGIGKLLGGAVAGVGNALLLTGTLAAPNPAIGYAAVASGGLAVSTFLAGLGDLRGE